MMSIWEKPSVVLMAPFLQQASDTPEYTILEYDATNDAYVPYSTGTPCAVLLETVAAGSQVVQAKVLFEGVLDEAVFSTAPDEDVKAALRNVGIYVLKRTDVQPA